MRAHKHYCPRCSSPALITSQGNGYDVAHCTNSLCNHVFRAQAHERASYRAKPEKWVRKTKAGSGVIAGRIEIGRGFRWGSGPV